MNLRCSKKGCTQVGTHHVYLEIYPPTGSYSGGPAQLYFPELLFCEDHAKELQWRSLIYEGDLLGLFRQLGKPLPDLSKTNVRLAVVQGVETV